MSSEYYQFNALRNWKIFGNKLLSSTNDNTYLKFDASGQIIFNTNENANVNIDLCGNLNVGGQITITGGTPGADKVLTSDAVGLATWEAASGIQNGADASLNNLSISNELMLGTLTQQGTIIAEDIVFKPISAPITTTSYTYGNNTSHEHTITSSESWFGMVTTITYDGKFMFVSNMWKGSNLIWVYKNMSDPEADPSFVLHAAQETISMPLTMSSMFACHIVELLGNYTLLTVGFSSSKHAADGNGGTTAVFIYNSSAETWSVQIDDLYCTSGNSLIDLVPSHDYTSVHRVHAQHDGKGDTFIITNQGFNDDGDSDLDGVIRLYKITTSGIATLLAEKVGTDTLLGTAVSISSNNYVAASHRDDINGYKGIVSLYKYNATTGELDEDVSFNNPQAASQGFGGAIAISTNGKYLIVGCGGADNTTGGNEGALYCYVYNETTSSWPTSHTQVIFGDTTQRELGSGDIIVLDDGTIFSGNQSDDNFGTGDPNNGSVSIFSYIDSSWALLQVIPPTSFPYWGLFGATISTNGSILAVCLKDVWESGGATVSVYKVDRTGTTTTTQAVANIDLCGNLNVDGQIKITGGTPGANKVLTSDAVGLATWEAALGGGGGGGSSCYFSGMLASDASITQGSWWTATGFTLNSIPSSSSPFDGSTFTVPAGEGGVYLFHQTMLLKETGDDTYQVDSKIENSTTSTLFHMERFQLGVPPGDSGESIRFWPVQIFAMGSCAAGDTVNFYIKPKKRSGSGTVTVLGNNNIDGDASSSHILAYKIA